MSWARFGRLGFDLGQQRVEVGQRLAELLAAAVERRRDRAEGLVELGRVDLVQHRDELLEDGVDLDGDVLALESPAPRAASPLTGRVGATSSTNFAPNTVDDAMSTPTLDGMSCSCDGSIARCRTAVPSGRVSIEDDLADLHAAHLHLGVGVHHQAGAIGDHRHRNGFGEAAAEQADRQRDDRDDRDDHGQARQWAAAAGSVHRLVLPYPDRLKLPLEP